jgi:hypothetical protein
MLHDNKILSKGLELDSNSLYNLFYIGIDGRENGYDY